MKNGKEEMRHQEKTTEIDVEEIIYGGIDYSKPTLKTIFSFAILCFFEMTDHKIIIEKYLLRSWKRFSFRYLKK